MDKNQAEWAIGFGVVMIAASFLTKRFFGTNGIFVSDKPIPTWLGQLIFWVVGGMMILAGVNDLTVNH
jgi:hypothetical protein